MSCRSRRSPRVSGRPSEAVVTLNGAENKAMADQIATVDKQRLQNCAGSISSNDMKLVERAVKVQLGLPL